MNLNEFRILPLQKKLIANIITQKYTHHTIYTTNIHKMKRNEEMTKNSNIRNNKN
jgi:hypothetical protein